MLFIPSRLALAVAGISALGLSSGQVLANEDASVTFKADPIVVTGTVGPRTAGESLSAVSVITEEELQIQQPVDLADSLRALPGVDVSGTGSFGKTTAVFVRGAGSQSTLLLVNGVRLQSASVGSPAWEFLPVDLLNRVEIVRGPRSTLYGADALGGVIQVFTPEPTSETSGWVEAGVGNFDTQKVNAGVSGGTDSTRVGVSGSFLSTDGTNLFENGEDKGYHNSSGTVSIEQDIGSTTQVKANLLNSEGNTEFEGGETDYLLRVISLGAESQITSTWTTDILFSRIRDERDSEGTFGPSYYDTRTDAARWLNTIAFDVHELVLGAEYRSEKLSSSDEYDETERDNRAVFSQLRFGFGPTDLQLSARLDDNEAFGDFTTWGIAIGHRLDSEHRLRASAGRSFRAPSFNELYYPNFGNPDLEPEQARSFELGASGTYETHYWDVAVFRTDIEDLITSTAETSFIPFNIDQARIQGLELSLGTDWEDWSLKSTLTTLDPYNQQTGKQLQRRATQSLRIQLDRTLGDWLIGSEFIAQGHRFDDAANENRIAGYGQVNLHARWNFAPDWMAQLNLDNITDRRYATAEGTNALFESVDYLAAGISGMFSVRYEFN